MFLIKTIPRLGIPQETSKVASNSWKRSATHLPPVMPIQIFCGFASLLHFYWCMSENRATTVTTQLRHSPFHTARHKLLFQEEKESLNKSHLIHPHLKWAQYERKKQFKIMTFNMNAAIALKKLSQWVSWLPPKHTAIPAKSTSIHNPTILSQRHRKVYANLEGQCIYG